MNEKVIEHKVCEYAKSKGMLAYKASSIARRGFPDRLFLCKGGISFYIEFKSTTGQLTVLQRKTINELIDYGQMVYVVNNVEQGNAIIDKYVNKVKNPDQLEFKI